MSWMVQHLLMNSELIHAQPDFESDEYNNLLVVESKINDLIKKGLISKHEKKVIDMFSDGKSLGDLETLLGINRVTVSKVFKEACDKVSFSLGGAFTDSGYVDYMVEKYKLSEEEADKLDKFIKSNLRHKIIRSSDNEY